MTSSDRDVRARRGGVRVAPTVYLTGWPGLLPAFFATVSARLEPEGAGSRFPALAELATGTLGPERALDLGQELAVIDRELGQLSVTDVESDEPDPDWVVDGRFTTIRGRDLVQVLIEATQSSQALGKPMIVYRDFLKRI